MNSSVETTLRNFHECFLDSTQQAKSVKGQQERGGAFKIRSNIYDGAWLFHKFWKTPKKVSAVSWRIFSDIAGCETESHYDAEHRFTSKGFKGTLMHI